LWIGYFANLEAYYVAATAIGLKQGTASDDIHMQCAFNKNLLKASNSSRRVSVPQFSRRGHARGFTLIELIVATAILVILTSLAVPMARVTIKRTRERELRADLWELRDAIDRYKDAADRNAFQTKVGSEGYPPDLDTLVNGMDVGGKKLKFLRRIPVDPMTGSKEWGMRSMQDDPDSDSWDGNNIFDVHTKSTDTALDGTKYKDW
jgi:general secretion pathway protein G